MARKKRKYIRRKPLRHDTIPMSSVLMGLLPLLFMAGIVGIYIFYQYADPFILPQVPELSPNISLPEITISFPEVGEVLTVNTAETLEFAVTAAEEIVSGVGYFFTETGAFFDTLVKLSIQGETVIADYLRKTVIEAQLASASYFQAVRWTVGDFFYYLDLPGKIQGFLNTLLWPLHFLNPMPAVQSTNQKIAEMSKSISHALSPVWPVLSYIWEEFNKTANQLWQNFIELLNFIGWMIEKNKN